MNQVPNDVKIQELEDKIKQLEKKGIQKQVFNISVEKRKKYNRQRYYRG